MNEIKEAFKENRLKYFYVNDKCTDANNFGYIFKNRKVEIIGFRDSGIAFDIYMGITPKIVEWKYVDIEKTKILIDSKEDLK